MGKNTNGSIGPVCSDCGGEGVWGADPYPLIICAHCGGEGVWGADPYPLIICAHCSGTGVEPQSLSKFVSGLQLEDDEV